MLLILAFAVPVMECTWYGDCAGDPMYCWEVVECVDVGVFSDGFG